MFPYALTVFLGAFLLFQIQPLMGKYLLPWFGGSPAVWTTCLLFFQLALLAGYLYAHGLASRLSSRAARALHIALIVASLGGLAMLALAWGSPILPGPSWKPGNPDRPVGRILALLAASIGLPYLLLSATSPLLQAWAARTHPNARVYRLYALSNLASLLALVSYPTLVERLLPLSTQAWLWSGTYALFAAGSLLCALRSIPSSASPSLPVPQSPSPSAPLPPTTYHLPPHKSQITNLLWFLYAAAGSMLLMAATNQMCQEVASIPFLWVLPLCLYLGSFVLCFQSERFYNRAVFGPLLLGALCGAAFVLFKGYTVPIRIQIAAYAVALFAACMVLHGELARSKPEPGRLTSFYLTISAGGAVGGIFVALLAPRLFRGFWEIHLALFLAGALAIAALARDRTSWLHVGRPWPAFLALAVAAAVVYYARDPEIFSSALARKLSLRLLISSGSAATAVAAGVLALVLLLRLRLLTATARPYLAGAFLAGALALVGTLLVSEIQASLQQAVLVSRNFYGVLTVERLGRGDPDFERLDLRHGRIVHGFQYWSLFKRGLPTTYYGAGSGIAVALEHHPRREGGPLRVGAVGLGVGTIATYGRSGDTYRFYDINPEVIALSTGRARLFTYLNDSSARTEIVPGDARLSLEREAARSSPAFDVLVVDAFTSDAIPVHLLTREAFELYLSRLALPDGLLAVHISNRQVDLEPVVRAAARSLSLSMCVVDRNEKEETVWATTWILLSRDPAVFSHPAIAPACARRETGPTVRLWTDDYSNLLTVMK